MSRLFIHYNKTRIAPTPSGYLHLGNVLSFAVTVAIAKETGAKILLRIDDLDQARAGKQYMQDIFDTLNFLEIPWDEGPRNAEEFEIDYSQLHRLDLYKEALKQLSDGELVFACTCSRREINACECMGKQIPLDTENVSWRMITNGRNEIVVKDFEGQINRVALPADMQHFVVKKKDQFPAYQLTSVIDDLFYGVDLIVRGEDLWPSTLAQHVLANALGRNGFKEITFYHHPLLMETSGKKISKSAGATSVKYLLESGKKPADIYRLIASMLGVEGNVANWQQLAKAAIPGIY